MEKMSVAELQEWVQSLQEHHVEFGPQFQAAILLCLAKDLQGIELGQMLMPFGPSMPFSVLKPRLADTTLTPVDSARALLKTLVQQKVLPAIAAGESGLASLKQVLITTKFLGDSFLEWHEKMSDMHAIFPECFGEIRELGGFLAQLVGDGKPSLPALDSIMGAKGECALVLVKQAVRTNAHWRGVEGELRRSILAEETMLPLLWDLHKNIVDGQPDWTVWE